MSDANGRKTPKRAQSSAQPNNKPPIISHFFVMPSARPLRRRLSMLLQRSAPRVSSLVHRSATRSSIFFAEMLSAKFQTRFPKKLTCSFTHRFLDASAELLAPQQQRLKFNYLGGVDVVARPNRSENFLARSCIQIQNC